MTLREARLLALCLLCGTLAGLDGCRSRGVEAAERPQTSTGGSGSGDDLSGPATFNDLFEARNPRTCSKVTGVPNASYAAALAQCEREAGSRMNGFTPILLLATDVKVEIGQPRRFRIAVDAYDDIDVNAPIYSLRGSATGWTCGDARDSAPYANCNKDDASPKATGSCWHTLFNDRRCQMSVGGGDRELRVKGPTTY